MIILPQVLRSLEIHKLKPNKSHSWLQQIIKKQLLILKKLDVFAPLEITERYNDRIIPEQFTAIGPPSFIWRGGGGAKKIEKEHTFQRLRPEEFSSGDFDLRSFRRLRLFVHDFKYHMSFVRRWIHFTVYYTTFKLHPGLK